jgi:hypothetical protein
MNGFFRRNGVKIALLLMALLLGVFVSAGCTGEGEERVRKKLDVICAGDLAAITDSVAVENMIDKPYYRIVFYKRYTEGKYTRKAVAEFYFLKKVAVKVVRKYRYLETVRMWDRYSNEYVFVHDTANGTAKK